MSKAGTDMNVQVESSLIFLTHPDVLTFIKNKLSPAVLKGIYDIPDKKERDKKEGKALWASSQAHNMNDINVKYVLLKFDREIDIEKFQNIIKGGILFSKYKDSIRNIQIPWSEKQTPTASNVNNNSNTNNAKNPVASSVKIIGKPIGKVGSFKIEQIPRELVSQYPGDRFYATFKDTRDKTHTVTGKDKNEVETKAKQILQQ